jgi:NADH-quinone oxidoreductase subunit F
MMNMTSNNNKHWIIRVGMASCGIAAGARNVFEALNTRLANRGLPVEVKQTGCLGMCYNEPLVEVQSPDGERTFYKRVDPEYVERILNEHVLGGREAAELAVSREEWDSSMGKQVRIVLRNCGIIDPENIDDYIASGGYEALKKALTGLTPEQVIEEIRISVRGRGGAVSVGPSGAWQAVCRSPKNMVCNADEGDPGAFMNRNVLESDSHSLIEEC